VQGGSRAREQTTTFDLYSAITYGQQGEMRSIELPWEAWRAVIAVLREKALPYMLDHADELEQQLAWHGPDEPTVRRSVIDDVFLRSYNWARWQLGIPLLDEALAHVCGGLLALLPRRSQYGPADCRAAEGRHIRPSPPS
jgi:hypothetical protein